MLTNKNKKVLKRWAKRHLEEQSMKNGLNVKDLLIHRADGDHDHVNHTLFVKAPDADTALKNMEREFPVWGMEIGPTLYDCTGQPFCDPADIREVAPERFVINLHIRYDV
jgi:hypothetical protein